MDSIEPTAARLQGDRGTFLRRYQRVRGQTEALAAPLSPEDQTIQSMGDVSPTKWHRAHTSWFFENFLLAPFLPEYHEFHPRYGYLFNSYYEGAGARHPRPDRGLLSRPSIAEIAQYRAHVDRAIEELVLSAGAENWQSITPLLELGLNHEEQHQELILMDIKHVLSLNPLDPPYLSHPPTATGAATTSLAFTSFEGGLCEIGFGGTGFAFDNEGPRHKVWLEPFRLGSRLATCGEYRAFIEAGGYRKPELWLSEGWATAQREGWEAPLYWRKDADAWTVFTLTGRRALIEDEPVCHVSYYEADAFARWSDKRLPTEVEWEVAASRGAVSLIGNLMDRGTFHPEAVTEQDAMLQQMIGDVWEWTASPYTAYPGYRAPAGTIGEYNGKFMSNQMVLRGGAAVTPPGHMRLSYRNFFPPASRWAFAGVRLAEDA
jgi:ergothioneine biosynthesis protein EgtB